MGSADAAAIIVTAVGEENDARVLPSQNNFPVVTALRDLPPGSLLRSNDLGWAKLADGLAPETYVIQGRDWIGPSELSGVLLTVGLKAGDPLPLKALIGSKAFKNCDPQRRGVGGRRSGVVEQP